MSEDKRDYKAMKDRVEFVAGNNNQTIQELGAKGIGINGDNIKELRFETFVSYVLGKTEDSVERLRFEERFHEAMEKALAATKKQAEKQAAMSRLHIPGQGPNGARGGQQ